MNSVFIKDFGYFYGDFQYRQPISIYGCSEAEYRAEFEKVMQEKYAPKLNKMQAHVYAGLTFDIATVKNIVENNRGMGKTTAHAMKQIAEAIQNPNVPIKLKSDHGGGLIGYRITGGYKDVVANIIKKLGLQFMEFDDVHQTLTFKV